MAKATRTMPTTVLLPPALRAKLVALAKTEQRSVSKQILVIIERAINQREAA